MEETNILHEVEQEINTESASVGQRFVNYLIDVIILYVIIFLIGIVAFSASAASGSDIQNNVLVSQDSSAILFQYLFWIVVIVAFYTIFEGATKGRTVGKFITGTKVVMEDGSNITWKQAFVRSLCRLVPFEPFSAFS